MRYIAWACFLLVVHIFAILGNVRYNFDMSKETFVFITGALVFFSPFMGLPREYTKWFLIGAGIVLMILGYRLRRLAFLRSLEDGSGERRADVFVENVGTLSDVSVPKKEEKQYV
jgi:hypothetical protein